jgi:hypothetical protein
MVNVGNWLTATIYFVAAYSCRSTANKTCSHEALFWRSIAILFVVLGFGKILNVQEALTDFGRAVAMSDGWYWHRFVFQKAFILIIGAGIVFLAVGFLTTARKTTVQCKVAFTCALLATR